jgi:hypothetical protein
LQQPGKYKQYEICHMFCYVHIAYRAEYLVEYCYVHIAYRAEYLVQYAAKYFFTVRFIRFVMIRLATAIDWLNPYPANVENMVSS